MQEYIQIESDSFYFESVSSIGLIISIQWNEMLLEPIIKLGIGLIIEFSILNFRMETTSWTTRLTSFSSPTICWARLSMDQENICLEFWTIETLRSSTRSKLMLMNKKFYRLSQKKLCNFALYVNWNYETFDSSQRFLGQFSHCNRQ